MECRKIWKSSVLPREWQEIHTDAHVLYGRNRALGRPYLAFLRDVGFVAPLEKWQEFERQWQPTLDQYGLTRSPADTLETRPGNAIARRR